MVLPPAAAGGNGVRRNNQHKPKRLSEHVELAPELQSLIDLNLPRAAARHKIKLTGIPLKYKNFQHRRGDDAEQIMGTQKRYDCQCRQLWSFLARRGAWDSMLLLLFPQKTKESTNCPAMDVEELKHFVRCKMNPNGMALKDGNNQQSNHLTDILGRPMYCDGGWHAGKTMDMFGTALSSIHKVHGHADAYMPSCPDCQENEETMEKGCEFHKHTRKSLAFRQGNPSLTDEFLKNKRTLEDPKYQARVSTQVDPGDVRAIRRAMLGGIPTIASLKFYAMILISIKLFLRADEIINLDVDSIPSSLFFRVHGILRAIGLTVSGKADHGVPKWYLLFMDDECRDLCPLRHFLLYVYFAKITGGYCFPSDKDLHDEETGRDGVYMRHESYSTLLNSVKKLAKDGVFDYEKKKKSTDFRATVHIFRKGAYCFRIIASRTDNIDWVTLRCDARHEREADMFIYVRDATTLRQTIDFEETPDMVFTDNRNVRFETLCAAEKHIGKASDATNISLFQLAKDYVLSLGLGPTPLLRKASDEALRPPEMDLQRRKRQFVSTLSQQQLAEYNRIERENCILHNNVLRSQAAAMETQMITQKPQKKKKKNPTNQSTTDLLDLVYDDVSRLNVSKLPTIAKKVEAYQLLQQRLPSKDSELTAKAKKWVIQSLRPALKCLNNHHNNSIEQYAEAWKGKWKMLHPCKGCDITPCVAISSSTS